MESFNMSSFSVWSEDKEGPSLLSLVAGAVLSVVFLYPSIFSLFSKRTVQSTLVLRKLKNVDPLPDHNRTTNVFANEFSDLFLKLVDILDFAVMKYVRDCPILVQQEHRHAAFHKKGQKKKVQEGDSLTRFWLLTKIFDLVLLRSGPIIGAHLACAVETASTNVLYYAAASPFISDYESDLVLFHSFEEVEHSGLTVQSLKKQTYFLVRLILLPLMLLIVFLFEYSPLITLTLSSPTLFITRPRTIIDMILFFGTASMGFLTGAWAVIAIWLSPFALESWHDQQMKYDFYQKRVQRRGILFEEEEKQTYPLAVR
jgi:hypothetical protein